MGSKLDVALDTRSSRDSKTSLNDQLDQLKAHGNMTDVSTEKPANESQRSVGEILSSMNQELQQSFPGPELLGEKALPKITNTSTGSAKKSTFWGKKNVSVFFYFFPSIGCWGKPWYAYTNSENQAKCLGSGG